MLTFSWIIWCFNCYHNIFWNCCIEGKINWKWTNRFYDCIWFLQAHCSHWNKWIKWLVTNQLQLAIFSFLPSSFKIAIWVMLLFLVVAMHGSSVDKVSLKCLVHSTMLLLLISSTGKDSSVFPAAIVLLIICCIKLLPILILAYVNK